MIGYFQEAWPTLRGVRPLRREVHRAVPSLTPTEVEFFLRGICDFRCVEYNDAIAEATHNPIRNLETTPRRQKQQKNPKPKIFPITTDHFFKMKFLG